MIHYQANTILLNELISIQFFIMLLLCYFYGSIPFSFIFTWIFTRKNIYLIGLKKGSIGNVFNAVGIKPGLCTLVGELSKAFLAVLIANFLFDGNLTVILIFIFATIVGANYSPFLLFSNNKGSLGGTVLLWSLLILVPYSCLAYAVWFGITFIITRNSRITNLIGHAALPLWLFLIERELSLVIFGVIIAVFFIVRYNMTYVRGNTAYDWYLNKKKTLSPKHVSDAYSNVYSNKFSKEFLPDMIKPLVWSINIPVVNTSWKRLFVELLGRKALSIDINQMAKQFYFRAYFNMGIIGEMFTLLGMPRESLELILLGIGNSKDQKLKFKFNHRIMANLPGIIIFLWMNFISAKRLKQFIKKQQLINEYYSNKDIEMLDEEETIKIINELFHINTSASYLVIVSQLRLGIYTMFLKKVLNRRSIDINNLNLITVYPALKDLNPSKEIQELQQQYVELTAEQKKLIIESNYKKLASIPEIEPFKNNIDKFLKVFGHLNINGNDFSQVSWKENPDLILEMIKGSNSMNKINVNKPASISLNKINLNWFSRYMVNKTAKNAYYKEKISFTYNQSYGLFRIYFLHLAKLFKQRNIIEEINDIFFLTYNEINSNAGKCIIPGLLMNRIEERKFEYDSSKNIELPPIIIGDSNPPILNEKNIIEKLQGLPVSRGFCEGKVKILRNLQDFSNVKDGDVLVIPYSDVSWTTVLTKARAIISESGGMLSHCAIIAREYGIPAVVAVPNALKLKDGTQVIVNGYSGEIQVRDVSKLQYKDPVNDPNTLSEQY